MRDEAGNEIFMADLDVFDTAAAVRSSEANRMYGETERLQTADFSRTHVRTKRAVNMRKMTCGRIQIWV